MSLLYDGSPASLNTMHLIPRHSMLSLRNSHSGTVIKKVHPKNPGSESRPNGYKGDAEVVTWDQSETLDSSGK